jgi:topoisomerase-4 subunit A
MTLPEGETPVVFALAPEGEVACVTRDGRGLVFNIEEIRLLPKGRGLKLIDAAPGKMALEEIIPVVDGAAGKLKGERLESCRGNRGGKGKPLKASRK